ncbi:KilA-N domain-containing protein [Caballeronia sp. LZ033]|uniref:KilA-N domain-containing protein n=1 Tax=Caballeronia sp. LZ033 TaxID=3038566 RepID=UPI0028546BCA|nr:KilA-N domain-containing protein [Caballeronia sp. LZ033]MDR5815818.1 KilA-N domain-containing protein [Caballeronia sp. LZ033]
MNSMIEIGGVAIHADKQGRYSLNDLHRAAGGEERHRPSRFVENQRTRELAQEIGKAGIPALVSVKGGRAPGTYACKEMVYAYAMWISAAFHVQVIRAYDALATGALEEAMRLAQPRSDRQAARLEAPALTDAVIHARKVVGKEVEHYHFVNEFDLINRVALGMSAKQYRAAHGLGPDDSIRDTLTALEIKCITHLQRYNASLIDFGLPYEKRKTELHKLYCLQYAGPLACEVQRLEA